MFILIAVTDVFGWPSIRTRKAPSLRVIEERLRGENLCTRREAVEDLKDHGGRGIPYLLGVILQNCDSSIRAAAASTLGKLEIYMGGRRDIRSFSKALNDENREVRVATANALIRKGFAQTQSAKLLSVLLEALNHGSRYERHEAIIGLENLGPIAKSAIGSLAASIEDIDPWINFQAAVALGKIDPANERTRAALRTIRLYPDSEVGILAQGILNGDSSLMSPRGIFDLFTLRCSPKKT